MSHGGMGGHGHGHAHHGHHQNGHHGTHHHGGVTLGQILGMGQLGILATLSAALGIKKKQIDPQIQSDQLSNWSNAMQGRRTLETLKNFDVGPYLGLIAMFAGGFFWLLMIYHLHHKDAVREHTNLIDMRQTQADAAAPPEMPANSENPGSAVAQPFVNQSPSSFGQPNAPTALGSGYQTPPQYAVPAQYYSNPGSAQYQPTAGAAFGQTQPYGQYGSAAYGPQYLAPSRPGVGSTAERFKVVTNR